MANRRAGETRAEKNEIRRLLFMGLSYEMVMLELKIPRSTFYRYLSQIQKEDEKLTLQAQSKGMDTMANWAKEQLMKSQLNLANMANNKTYEPRDRIASEALRHNAIVLILKVHAEQSAIATNKGLIYIDNEIKQKLPEQLQQEVGSVIEYGSTEPQHQSQELDTNTGLQQSDNSHDSRNTEDTTVEEDISSQRHRSAEEPVY